LVEFQVVAVDFVGGLEAELVGIAEGDVSVARGVEGFEVFHVG
jgi:hypothetical protein